MQNMRPEYTQMIANIIRLDKAYLVDKMEVHLRDHLCHEKLKERVMRTNFSELMRIRRHIKDTNISRSYSQFSEFLENRVQVLFRSKEAFLSLDSQNMLYAYVELFDQLDSALNNLSLSEINTLIQKLSLQQVIDSKHELKQNWMFGLMSVKYTLSDIINHIKTKRARHPVTSSHVEFELVSQIKSSDLKKDTYDEKAIEKISKNLIEQLEEFTRNQILLIRETLAKKVEEEAVTMQCSMTLEVMKQPVLTACGHYYDAETELFKKLIADEKSACPECREPLSKGDILADDIAKSVIDNFRADYAHDLLDKPDITITTDMIVDYTKRFELRQKQILQTDPERLARYNALKRVQLIKRIFKLENVFSIQDPVISPCGHYVNANSQLCVPCNRDLTHEKCLQDAELTQVLNEISESRIKLVSLINIKNKNLPIDIDNQIEQYNQASQFALNKIITEKNRYEKLYQLEMLKLKVQVQPIKIELIKDEKNPEAHPEPVLRASRIPAHLLKRINDLILNYENVRTCFFRGRRLQKKEMWVELNKYIDADDNRQKSFAQCIDIVLIAYPDATSGVFTHATADLLRDMRLYREDQSLAFDVKP